MSYINIVNNNHKNKDKVKGTILMFFKDLYVKRNEKKGNKLC